MEATEGVTMRSAVSAVIVSTTLVLLKAKLPSRPEPVACSV
jgi:hypothetical protein